MNKFNKTLFITLSLLLTNCYEIDGSSDISSEMIYSPSIEESNSDTSIDSETSTEESNSSESSSSSEEDMYVSFTKPIKLYVNPSVQYSNLYASSLGNEGEYMNKISNILVDMLTTYTNLIVYANNSLPGKSLSSSVSESNSLNVDYHLSLHSNAGGGKGSEGWYSSTSYNFTKSIIDSLQEVLPYPTRGLKYGQSNLYELKRTNASACLIEILFHDDEKQALFIINNQYEIAKAIFNGIVSYFK